MKGTLVKNQAGEIGIVTDMTRDKIMVLLGDGLRMDDYQVNWEPVLFGKTNIPCSFVELLPIYELAPDLRVRWAEYEKSQKTVINELTQAITSYERRINRLINQLFERVEAIDGLKRETTEVLLGKGLKQ